MASLYNPLYSEVFFTVYTDVVFIVLKGLGLNLKSYQAPRKVKPAGGLLVAVVRKVNLPPLSLNFLALSCHCFGAGVGVGVVIVYP